MSALCCALRKREIETAKIQSQIRTCWESLDIRYRLVKLRNNDPPLSPSVWCLGLDPDASKLASGHASGQLSLWNARDGQHIISIPDAHLGGMNCCTFSPFEGHLLMTGGEDGVIACWDTRYIRKAVYYLHAHRHWVKNVEFISERAIISGGYDGLIGRWSVFPPHGKSGELYHTTGRPSKICRYDEDEDRNDVMDLVIEEIPAENTECLIPDLLRVRCFRSPVDDTLFLVHSSSNIDEGGTFVQHLREGLNDEPNVLLSECQLKMVCGNFETVTALDYYYYNGREKLMITTRGTSGKVIGGYWAEEQELTGMFAIDHHSKPEFAERLFVLEDSMDDTNIIKGPCFTYDGRSVFSPYYFGMREIHIGALVDKYLTGNSFGDNDLKIYPSLNTHNDYVLCCRPAPNLPYIYASGLDGRISVYQKHFE